MEKTDTEKEERRTGEAGREAVEAAQVGGRSERVDGTLLLARIRGPLTLERGPLTLGSGPHVRGCLSSQGEVARAARAAQLPEDWPQPHQRVRTQCALTPWGRSIADPPGGHPGPEQVLGCGLVVF